MRTPRQRMYDKVYYDFEHSLYKAFRNYHTFVNFLFVRYDRDFYEAYRKVIRPFWKKYGVNPGLYWIKHSYNVSHSLDPRCIPRGIWFGDILPYFNSSLYQRQLQDKNLHHLLFHDMKRPATVYKYLDDGYSDDELLPLSQKEAYARCLQPGTYIIKPTIDTFEGSGIRVFCGEDGRDSVERLLDTYAGYPHIVQQFVEQHPDLAVFSPTAFNTVRIVTLVLHGEVHILSSILRIGGAGNFVDNVSQGGYQCTIRPDGFLEKTAYTCRSKHRAYEPCGGTPVYVEKTHTGAFFDGFRVPSWDKLKQTACALALRLPYMKLVGWDLGVDVHGDVVLIEFNAFPEQNEATCGPSFGDLTDEVLTEVYLSHPQRSVLDKCYRKYIPV